ncbi:hypothetical protein PTKIN_Ptkin05aG0107800 [Pterospermum kingtungense]
MASKLPLLHISCTKPLSPELRNSKVCSARHNIHSVPRRSNSFSSHLSLSSSFWLIPDKSRISLSPHWLHRQRPNATKSVTVRSQLNLPLISTNDHWGNWTVLFATTAIEKTKVGSALSGAIVGALIGLAASNLGLISCDAKAYSVVLEFLLPLAVPLLLFSADLRRVLKSTGKLLLPFLLGSVATTVGTTLAYLIVPMRALGQDSWKIAAALMGRHIGGAVNYVAISNALGVSLSVLAAGLAADNVICAVYFTSLFALASKVPPETSASTNDVVTAEESESGGKLPVLKIATALAPASNYSGCCDSGNSISDPVCLSFFIWGGYGSNSNAAYVSITLPPTFFQPIVLGKQIAIHLAVILGLGKLFRFDLKLLLIALNANVGGPTTACGMATAKGWTSMVIPDILARIFGIAIATFIGIGFGLSVLKYL